MQVINNKNLYEPLELTSWQRQVLEALKGTETEKYPLSKWYHGVLYVLDNPHNPDRISQAAQSLRELVEKLLEVVPGIGIQTKPSSKKSTFQEKRSNIEKRLLAYKASHLGNWEGQAIDGDLAKGLTTLEEYLELNKQPNRAEKIAKAMAGFDPMFDRLNSQIQEEKQKQLKNLWRELEGFAHHSSKTEEELRRCLGELEKIVFYLLAPITAEDQKKIQKILSCSDRSENDVEQMFSLIERRGANFVFFFKYAAETADATWLPFLNERDYFADVLWWTIHYLAKIADQVPDEAIAIVQQLPETDNSWGYHEIVEMALRLHGEQSAKLKRKIFESTDINDQLLAYKYAELLAHWTAENQTSAALELTRILVKFVRDPQSETKQKRRREDPTDAGTFYETSLDPSPRIGSLGYNEIMSKGVRPLAEKEPYQVARILTKATADMIHLRTHQVDFDQGKDSSKIWYERLHSPHTGYENPDKTLVHTLIFACEQVYEKSPDSVMDLDKTLRDRQWGVFEHIRQHLYAQYPNEITKPWIQELILEHKGYQLWQHNHEFQRMIRCACEYFGETLLTEAERTQIFDSIHSGPSKANYRWWIVEGLGEEFTEERFQQHQYNFHWRQFKPFEPLLFGAYTTYFQELEAKVTDSISDEDYSAIETMSGAVSNHSPHSPENLAALTDEELLATVNEWEGNELFPQGDPLIEINIEGLAGAFQTVFEESILPDANRLRFWIEHSERIERPIYVRMMINGMQAEVKEKNFNRLDEWLTFSEWVLSHPNEGHENDYSLGRQGDESRENPDWYNSRGTVGDFIGTCLEKDVDAPDSARRQLAKLLEMLCTQFDRHLDHQETDLSNQNNLIDKAINNTRARALETLVKFGFWLQRHDSTSETPEMTTILEKRFAPETERPLTPPEYAILGRRYPWICSLNEAWATKHKSDFFPQSVLPAWLAAFSSFVSHKPLSKSAFEILQADFDFALRYLTKLKKREGYDEKQTDIFGRPLKQNSPEEKLTEGIGQHLFTYYLWGLYPLKQPVGADNRYSLLERYYQATDNNLEHWSNLFNYAGRILQSTHEELDKDLKDRIISFFNWRFEVKEPREFQHFTFWLQAGCLEPEWRLKAYSKILEVFEAEDVSVTMQLKTLCELLPDHTAKVVKCFTKLTEKIKYSNIYIAAENAKIILKAGLSSSDEDVYKNAENARENLLSGGKLNISDFND